MKCLTICQPWAWAIIHGPKRIENRTWRTTYTGPLLIHAGKSRSYLKGESPLEWPARYGVALPDEKDLCFGHILGIVDMIYCEPAEYQAHAGDPFAEGPWCWRLNNPRPFAEPIAYAGKLHLYEVPPTVIDQQLRKLTLLRA